LLDPEASVAGEPDSSAIVELLDRTQQPGVPFLYDIFEGKVRLPKALSDVHDEAQIRLGEAGPDAQPLLVQLSRSRQLTPQIAQWHLLASRRPPQGVADLVLGALDDVRSKHAAIQRHARAKAQPRQLAPVALAGGHQSRSLIDQRPDLVHGCLDHRQPGGRPGVAVALAERGRAAAHLLLLHPAFMDCARDGRTSQGAPAPEAVVDPKRST
jgi:hypothetical protein